MLPLTAFPIDGMTVIEQRVIAIFLLAALCWVLEPFPIYATSVLVIVVELLLVSDKGLIFLRSDAGSEHFGELVSYKAIMATMASPIIMLFLGGFFLAMAATKYRLDVNLARVLLKPFGERPAMVMLGLMGITAIFSMFMSNTATTAMMLSILAPVLGLFKAEDRGRIAFALSIPVAANIGGIGTPIGTPPNAIALKYLVGEDAISFGSWMAFAVPFVVVMLIFAWGLLVKMFPATQQSMALNIRGKFQRSPKAILVYVTFAATILLWLFGSAHGMNSYVVAMIPVAVFSVTKVITKEDLKKISWDVLWLVAGGFALGLAMDKSGLARNMVAAIPFDQFSPYVVILAASGLCLLMANFMSHTATANLLMPIVVALAVSMDSLVPLGGTQAIILCVTFAASLGMSLPISTPPNALAHATGYMQTSDMAKVGVIIGVVGLMLTYAMVFLLLQIGYL
ncbi:SLC13 family permease [Corallincola platygyrae]